MVVIWVRFLSDPYGLSFFDSPSNCLSLPSPQSPIASTGPTSPLEPTAFIQPGSPLQPIASTRSPSPEDALLLEHRAESRRSPCVMEPPEKMKKQILGKFTYLFCTCCSISDMLHYFVRMVNHSNSICITVPGRELHVVH